MLCRKIHGVSQELDVLVTDDAGRIVGCSPTLAQRLGVPADRLAPGAPLAGLVGLVPPALRLEPARLGAGLTLHRVRPAATEGPEAEAAELEALRTEVALLRETLDSLDAGVVVYDAALRYRFGNRVYHDIFPHLPPDSELVGESYAQVLGRSIDAGAVVNPDAYTDRAGFIARREVEVADRGVQPYEIHGPGTDRSHEIRAKWTPNGYRVSLRIDTSQTTRLHRQLLAAQREETISRLGGEVAHDFNNLLTVIIGNLELMQDHQAALAPEQAAEVGVLTRAALAAAEAGAELTGRLLQLASQSGDPTRHGRVATPVEAGDHARREAAMPRARPVADATILMVEDDPEVLITMARVIAGLGYRLLQAGGSAEALTVLQGTEPVDLLFSDIVMPASELNGVELARAATRLRPGLRVLLTTGYSADALDDGVPDGASVLPKPYRISDLATRLVAMLGPPLPAEV